MSHSIPEYYRHFIQEVSQQELPQQHFSPQEPQPQQGTPQAPSQHEAPAQRDPEDPTWTYRAHAFTLSLDDEWSDRTLFSLVGPVTDGIQHLITVAVNPEVEVDAVRDFVDWNVRILERQLQGCQVIEKEPVTLANGLPAHRVIYVWHPVEDRKVYQEQLYVIHEGVGYILTASFSKKTRKTLGPRIRRFMLSFNPAP